MVRTTGANQKKWSVVQDRLVLQDRPRRLLPYRSYGAQFPRLWVVMTFGCAASLKQQLHRSQMS